MLEESSLVSVGCSPLVVAHCMAVSRTALSITERVSVPVDRELVRLGGLFHDIGRARTHDIDHAVIGVEIAKKIGCSEQLLDIIERHIGAGITAAEAGRLGLPKKDYLPMTPEEKIVSYADNLINGIHEMPFEKAVERFRLNLGPNHEGVSLFIKQHREIQRWMK